MSIKNKGNHKHLTFSERVYIEQSLLQELPFSKIAEFLEKDPTTISKEVRRSSQIVKSKKSVVCCNKCMFKYNCEERNICSKNRCNYLCKNCYHVDPTEFCVYFKPYQCNKPSKPPYVCNACTLRSKCILDKPIYNAKHAHTLYTKTLTTSRTGINLTPDELKALNELITPLILKGQPLSHIFATHSDDIPCCRRTLYNYLDQRIFQARNIDLPRRVRYKKRRRSKTHRAAASDQSYRNNRTYKDFLHFMDAHPGYEVVEMDTVKGSRDKGKCLLTLLFRKSSFMLIILLPRCTQEEVINAINNLSNVLSSRLFKKTFRVILTDNGPEFKNPNAIEKDAKGKRRTYVFFCDPYVSNQKARIEKNHEYIRYVIPKGRSMHNYTQDNINLLASHINSTSRDSLNGNSPFDMASLLLDKKVPLLTGLQFISPDNVMLKPELLK